MPDAMVFATGAHDQAHERTGDRPVCVGASGRGQVSSGQFLWERQPAPTAEHQHREGLSFWQAVKTMFSSGRREVRAPIHAGGFFIRPASICAFPSSLVRFFAIGIEHALDVPIQRAHEAGSAAACCIHSLRDALLKWRVRCFYRAMTGASHGKRDRFRQITNENHLCLFLNSSPRLLRAA